MNKVNGITHLGIISAYRAARAAGVLIDQSLERELRQHLDKDINLKFDRIGILPSQILEHDLPTKPRKESDKRAMHVGETVEAEALPAAILRRILRGNIERLLPERALSVAKAYEESEREHLLQMAGIVGGRNKYPPL